MDVRAQYAPLLEELKDRIAEVLDSGRFILGPEVKALESELEASLAFLSTCHSACESEVSSVHSCPTCAHHAEQPNPPELVAGSRVN